jgi:urocanate reductase
MVTKKEPAGAIGRREFLRKGAAAGAGAVALGGLASTEAAAQQRAWDRSADVVICGAGTSGLAAAVSALDNGATVIVVEENHDCGGHGILSGGNVNLGGGTSRQKKWGVEDSPDQVFEDWIRYDRMVSRYSDREIVRVYADESAATFEWLVENGVEFEDSVVGGGDGMVARQGRSKQWPVYEELITSHPTRVGSGVLRAMEKSARRKGAEILLSHRLTSLVREAPFSGRVQGISVEAGGRTLTIEAKKGVVICTGGCSSNVIYRRTFDPRLTEEYQVTGEPWSRQSGDGELAAMDVGASLWATAQQTNETGAYLAKTAHIGARWGYGNLQWLPDSPIFDKIRASGLTNVDWQNAIMVQQNGKRFYNETASGYDFFAAAMQWSGDPNKLNGGGPIWAIFDGEAVTRQRWDPTPPNIDPGNGYFFVADTLAELARKVVMPYQTIPMPPEVLEASVARYNSFVDSGKDEDFAKPTPKYKIQTPPFYAAWTTPILHDSLTGLHTNTKGQVMDRSGEVIPGLYAAGESMGGFAQHGLGRCLLFGRVAGRDAATSGGVA